MVSTYSVCLRLLQILKLCTSCKASFVIIIRSRLVHTYKAVDVFKTIAVAIVLCTKEDK